MGCCGVNVDGGVAGGGSSTTITGLVPAGLPHPEDIIFYVDASNAGSYPGSGTDVTDMSGNATDGTLDGGTAVVNGSFVFDADNAKGVSFTKNAALDNVFDGGATLMTVVRLDGNTGSGRFVSTENAGDTTGWSLHGVIAFSADGNFPVFVRRSAGGTDGSWSGSNAALPLRGAPSGGGNAYGSFSVTYDDSVLSNDPTLSVNGQRPNTPSGTNPSALGSDVGSDIIIGNRNGGSSNPDCDSRITIIWGNGRILTQSEQLTAHNVFASLLNQIGSSPGTATVESDGLAGAPHLVRIGGLMQPPEPASGNDGCTDLGLYSDTGKGITGSGTTGGAILSGRDNELEGGADFSCVVSGQTNRVGTSSNGVIAGGTSNTITGGGPNFIGAGQSNNITGVTSAVVAGSSNSCSSGTGDIIGAGSFNNIGTQGVSDHNIIGAGFDIGIIRGSKNCIVGGDTHRIGAFSAITSFVFIGGGQANKIGVIGGNEQSDWSFIGGGKTNEINGAQYGVIPGGRENDITDGADYGYAAGRRAQVDHAGAYLWSDSTDQDEDSNRVNQHKVVATGGVAERTTVGFGGDATDPGEAPERFNGHATTTDATPDVTTIGTLATNQRTMMFEVEIHSSRDTGTDFRFDKFVVTVYRTGGTVTVGSESVMTPVDPSASGVTYSFGNTGDNVEITITGVISENWQHTYKFTRQQGGLTS